MEKKQINIDLLLPEVADDHDDCVQRVIELVEQKKGISKVHLVSGVDHGRASLCFHYDPNELFLTDIEKIAREAGANITEKYGHILLNVEGVRHARHARTIEQNLKGHKGILFVAVSGSGIIRIEYDKNIIGEPIVRKFITEEHLRIIEVNNHLKKNAEKGHTQDHEHEHVHHHHLMIFGERTELIFAIISGVLLVIGFALTFMNVAESIPISILAISYITGGTFAVMEAIEGLKKGNFEIDFLMVIAAIGAAILGKWVEGSFLLFLFSLGHSLEHYAFARARSSVASLANLYPKKALVKRGEDIEEVLVENLQIGDRIIVKPNGIISADGIVVGGASAVNQAPITGESVPVEKEPLEHFSGNEDYSRVQDKNKVFAGTINGNRPLEISVSRLTSDSTLSRLIQMVRDAQTQKSKVQLFTDRVERYYVPFVLVLVTLLLFVFLVKDESFGQSFYRAMAVLIAASPCALAISTPSAVLSGISKAAMNGVLVKGGLPMENLASVNAIAFDKTGTITEGKHSISKVVLLKSELTETQLLRIVVGAEQLSDHPLALAIVRSGQKILGEEVSPAHDLQVFTGRGIEAFVSGQQIRIGNQLLMEEVGVAVNKDALLTKNALEMHGQTTLLVSSGKDLIGLIALQDKPREDALSTIKQLEGIGIEKMMMLTGDNQQVAEDIAKQVGLSIVKGSLLPEHKLDALKEWRNQGLKVAMVGDGVNDAPAMATSDVGIAMGAAGSPIALETADIALMSDNFSKIAYGIKLSRKTRSIVRQNLVISIGMVVILVPLAISGLSIAPAVIGHEGSTMVVVLNALRLFGFKDK